VPKPAVTENFSDLLQESEKSLLQVSINPLHDSPCVLEDEAFLVSFKKSQESKVTDFNLLPAGKEELLQLALFLGTCTYFHTTVTHEIVPGQHITSVPNFDGRVQVTFSTDADLVELLADPGIVEKLTLTLNIDQLEAYEEFIRSAITTNQAIHEFNVAILEANRSYLLAG
jgi:hypothetical protein